MHWAVRIPLRLMLSIIVLLVTLILEIFLSMFTYMYLALVHLTFFGELVRYAAVAHMGEHVPNVEDDAFYAASCHADGYRSLPGGNHTSLVGRPASRTCRPHRDGLSRCAGVLCSAT